MPGVTISAGYGAGGSVVAPGVAQRLGLPVLDRAISSRVAALLQVTVPEAVGGEIQRPLVDRLLGIFTPLAGGLLCAGTDAAPPEAVPPPDDAALFREHAEGIMSEALAAGAVILGRAGAAAFRGRPDVLRVRLFGPPEARIVQASRIENVDLAAARQLLPEVDRARAQYVRRLYGLSIYDPDLFDLQIDSTALPLDACADIIVSAYRTLDRTQALTSAE
jgi:cytidylate kinase